MAVWSFCSNKLMIYIKRIMVGLTHKSYRSALRLMMLLRMAADAVPSLFLLLTAAMVSLMLLLMLRCWCYWQHCRHCGQHVLYACHYDDLTHRRCSCTSAVTSKNVQSESAGLWQSCRHRINSLGANCHVSATAISSSLSISSLSPWSRPRATYC